MILLKSMAAQGGNVDAAAFGKATLEFAGSYPGRLNHVVKEFQEAVSAGKAVDKAGSDENHQAHSITKVPIVVARYAGKPEMMDKVWFSRLVPFPECPGVHRRGRDRYGRLCADGGRLSRMPRADKGPSLQLVILCMRL